MGSCVVGFFVSFAYAGDGDHHTITTLRPAGAYRPVKPVTRASFRSLGSRRILLDNKQID